MRSFRQHISSYIFKYGFLLILFLTITMSIGHTQSFPSCLSPEFAEKAKALVKKKYDEQVKAVSPTAPGAGSYVQQIDMSPPTASRAGISSTPGVGWISCHANFNLLVFKNGQPLGRLPLNYFFEATYDQKGNMIVQVVE